MPRSKPSTVNPAAGQERFTEQQQQQQKPLPSLADEIETVLSNISSILPAEIMTASSIAVLDDDNCAAACINWSALPAAVDASSTSMGFSTRVSEKKRAKKHFDVVKVNARIARKRQQVQILL
jgi:hypothetical protein